MSDAFLPFAQPEIDDDEINEVVSTMRSGWLTTGPKTRQFEADFAQFLGDTDLQTIAVNSATSGLHLALEAVGVKAGDEVITTTYTFTATAAVIHYLGAKPVFVDVDPNTLNIDPAKMEAAITPRTKAIIPVHIAGLSCDMGAILEIAKRRNLRVIEDAAHALPTTCEGKLIGTL
ncbi:MAG: DegT/DnrJ/EryC1/StrS aminotransferase family protein, partial [Armatimonadetes bacterium]|nr:DegT/DnrJ/EryC1/StrS aminotransferase family protein [Armatimonadota bacterium]